LALHVPQPVLSIRIRPDSLKGQSQRLSFQMYEIPLSIENETIEGRRAASRESVVRGACASFRRLCDVRGRGRIPGDGRGRVRDPVRRSGSLAARMEPCPDGEGADELAWRRCFACRIERKELRSWRRERFRQCGRRGDTRVGRSQVEEAEDGPRKRGKRSTQPNWEPGWFSTSEPRQRLGIVVLARLRDRQAA